MKKIALGLMAVAVPFLSGCSLPSFGGSSAPSVSFARSSDGGVTFVSKSTVDEKTNFASAEIVSMAVDAQNTRHIFLGTRESGLFVSENSGDSWRKITYPPTKVYGLVVDANDSKHLFATGEWQGRGKIYRSNDGGDNWDEVYTEPANGTVMTALAQDPFNPQVIYAGTSAGMVIRSSDGGATWKNVIFTPSMSGHIIWSITFDTHQNNVVYFLVDGKGVFVSDGEKIITEPASASFGTTSTTVSVGSKGVLSLAIDPSRSGVLYVGSSQGMFRSRDFAKTWESLNIITSAKKLPISAIAVNPKNSDEILYVSALTLYKSIDSGVHWSTHQIVSDKPAYLLRYDAYDPQTIFIGFKK